MVNVRRTASIDFDRDRMGTPEAVRGTVVRFAAAVRLLVSSLLFAFLRAQTAVCAHMSASLPSENVLQRLVRTQTPQRRGVCCGFATGSAGLSAEHETWPWRWIGVVRNVPA